MIVEVFNPNRPSLRKLNKRNDILAALSRLDRPTNHRDPSNSRQRRHHRLDLRRIHIEPNRTINSFARPTMKR